jgi:hypothetical protein
LRLRADAFDDKGGLRLERVAYRGEVFTTERRQTARANNVFTK